MELTRDHPRRVVRRRPIGGNARGEQIAIIDVDQLLVWLHPFTDWVAAVELIAIKFHIHGIQTDFSEEHLSAKQIIAFSGIHSDIAEPNRWPSFLERSLPLQ